MVLADRVRFPVPLFIYAKLCVNMIKTLWNIYIKRKTRNLTRIPIFAMIGDVRMCKFCNNEPRAIIQSIKQKPDVIEMITAGIEGGNILKVIGTLQSSHFVGVIPLEAETKIFYCPMCGRKLV